MTNLSSSQGQETILSAREITKSFGTHEVLKGISMTAQKGDVIAILGSSGSGKSTFLRCLNLLELPTSGQISVHGSEVSFPRAGKIPTRKLNEMRQRLGMVFQQFNLWSHRTALENVMEGPVYVQGVSRSEARDKAEAYLERVGLAEKMNAYPGNLSGGQQQRVAIARALAMEPDAILFDEPTSALDPELVGEVLTVMRDLAQEGRTMIVVTHEMDFARAVASRIVFLHQGKILEEGKPDQMFEAPKTDAFKRFITKRP